MKGKIAAVIQRYGEEVGGGEALCRHVAHALAGRGFDLTILTSCARDYISWANFYPAGEQWDGPVRVLRFPVKFERPLPLFHLLSMFVLKRRFPWIPRIDLLERWWLRLQGPYCPDLVRYLAQHEPEYKAVLFYTYLYYPTVRGIALAAPKSILIPTAHDERPIYLSTYKTVFESAAGLVFLSPEEQDLVGRNFRVFEKPQRLAGVALKTVGRHEPREKAVRTFMARKGLDRPYFLYLGRIDPVKGCAEMFEHFLRYVEETGAEVDLALVGRAKMDIPVSPAIKHLGFLCEAEKRLALAGCQALILLSPYESYSIALHEAFLAKRPAIVSAESAVLKGHIDRCEGGFAVANYPEFREAADALLSGRYPDKGEKGYRYVMGNASLGAFEDVLLDVMDELNGHR